jgi:prepilin-type processing-associated H-X9-DG protein
MFKIIGGDGKEYGPISAETLRDWLRQGRVNGSTRVLPEDSGSWVELRSLADFQADLAAERPPVPRPATATAAPVTVAAGPDAPRSGMATTSLVLGILGFLTLGITSIFGLILGIVALVKINGSQGRLGGKGVATAGVVTSGVGLVFVPIIAILAGLLLPALGQAKGKAQQINCMNNLKQIALAVRMYSGDHKDTFPAAAKWCDDLAPYLGGTTRPFQCPAHPGARCSYAYNPRVASVDEAKVNPQTVVIFESDAGWNAAGGPEAVARRHLRGLIGVAFADGHVEMVTPERLAGLRWSP